MRTKVSTSKKAISKPISLYPDQLAFVSKRCNGPSISVSKYFQALLEYDRAKNVLGDALTMGIGKIA